MEAGAPYTLPRVQRGCYKGGHSLRINVSLAVVPTPIRTSNPTQNNMRFLAHAHLVVLGLLSLGITAYAQECSQDTDCGRNQCCLGVRSLDSLEYTTTADILK
jgi:hypothetical protein